MRLETTKAYVTRLKEEGFSFSVVTPSDFKVVAPNVSLEQIAPSNVEIGFVRWPSIKGGKYDGHRLFHHKKETSEGEFVMLGHGY